jgi:UDP-glucose 4-epimerase
MFAVVTGGTGFIGKALVTRLRGLGVRVRTYSRRPAVAGEDHVSGALADMLRLRHALCGADHVFHLAWTTVPQTSNNDPVADVSDNLTAGCLLLEACRLERVGCVTFLSSGGTVYGGRHHEPIVEAAPTEPICSYGITKLAVEKYLALYRHLHGLDYRILRVSNAYGEGQPTNRPQGLIGVAFDRLRRGEPIQIWGDGEAVRDYIHLDDIVSACVAAMRHLPDGADRIFNVSAQIGYSIREVLATLEATTRRVPLVTYQSARACDLDRVVLSNARASQVLGWRPLVSLPEGVRRTWESIIHTDQDCSAQLPYPLQYPASPQHDPARILGTAPH